LDRNSQTRPQTHLVNYVPIAARILGMLLLGASSDVMGRAWARWGDWGGRVRGLWGLCGAVGPAGPRALDQAASWAWWGTSPKHVPKS
jgi:hypothetical protein